MNKKRWLDDNNFIWEWNSFTHELNLVGDHDAGYIFPSPSGHYRADSPEEARRLLVEMGYITNDTPEG